MVNIESIFASKGVDSMFCLILLFCQVAFHCFKFCSFYFSLCLIIYTILSSGINQFLTCQNFELSSLPLNSNFILIEFYFLCGDSAQGFPYESSSCMLYRVLKLNSFYSFCYYHHDHCLVSIVTLYYM